MDDIENPEESYRSNKKFKKISIGISTKSTIRKAEKKLSESCKRAVESTIKIALNLNKIIFDSTSTFLY